MQRAPRLDERTPLGPASHSTGEAADAQKRTVVCPQLQCVNTGNHLPTLGSTSPDSDRDGLPKSTLSSPQSSRSPHSERRGGLAML